MRKLFTFIQTMLRLYRSLSVSFCGDTTTLTFTTGLQVEVSAGGDVKLNIPGDCRVDSACFYFNCEPDFTADDYASHLAQGEDYGFEENEDGAAQRGCCSSGAGS